MRMLRETVSKPLLGFLRVSLRKVWSKESIQQLCLLSVLHYQSPTSFTNRPTFFSSLSFAIDIFEEVYLVVVDLPFQWASALAFLISSRLAALLCLSQVGRHLSYISQDFIHLRSSMSPVLIHTGLLPLLPDFLPLGKIDIYIYTNLELGISGVWMPISSHGPSNLHCKVPRLECSRSCRDFSALCRTQKNKEN